MEKGSMPEIPGCCTTSSHVSQYASQMAFWLSCPRILFSDINCSMSKLYANCVQQCILCKGSCCMYCMYKEKVCDFERSLNSVIQSDYVHIII